MKNVITNKWVTGAPQVTARFRNWDTEPQLSETDFAVQLPAGCRTVVVDGTRLHRWGGTYYQVLGNRYVIVYVD